MCPSKKRQEEYQFHRFLEYILSGDTYDRRVERYFKWDEVIILATLILLDTALLRDYTAM